MYLATEDTEGMEFLPHGDLASLTGLQAKALLEIKFLRRLQPEFRRF